jgi:hypothetical protein
MLPKSRNPAPPKKNMAKNESACRPFLLNQTPQPSIPKPKPNHETSLAVEEQYRTICLMELLKLRGNFSPSAREKKP